MFAAPTDPSQPFPARAPFLRADELASIVVGAERELPPSALYTRPRSAPSLPDSSRTTKTRLIPLGDAGWPDGEAENRKSSNTPSLAPANVWSISTAPTVLGVCAAVRLKFSESPVAPTTKPPPETAAAPASVPTRLPAVRYHASFPLWRKS